MVTPRNVAVLGAGNGGLAAAADLALRGFDVTLVSRSAAALAPLLPSGAIQVEGLMGERVAHVLPTTDIAAAVDRADLVMLVVPATELASYGRLLAHVIKDDQPILLNPGGVGGSLHLAHELRLHGCTVEPQLCEFATLSYTARKTRPDTVRITNRVPNLPFAALPGSEGPSLHALVTHLYPNAVLYDSVLDTAFAGSNVIAHPPQVLLNAARIEDTGGDFYFYSQGTTPAVGRLMDALDRERLAIAASLGIQALSYPQIVLRNGYTSREAAATGSAYECAQAGEASRFIKSPSTLDHRFLHEDIGFGLVPLTQWASLTGTLTPVMDSLVIVGGVVSGMRYVESGLTLPRMGLDGADADGLRRLVGRV